MADQPTPTELRVRISADITAQTGITEAMIDRVVRGFYDRIRKDAVLGPVFESRITDWGKHMLQMGEFWSSVALMSGRYHGSPMAKHKDLLVDIQHFKRWLALFDETLTELCPPAAQAYFIERAQRIARSLSIGVADHASRLGPAPVLTRPGGPT